MSRNITIQIDDATYAKFNEMAVEANRSVSNLIETLALKKLEEELFTDTFETSDILSNKPLITRLKKGHKCAIHKKGHLIGLGAVNK